MGATEIGDDYVIGEVENGGNLGSRKESTSSLPPSFAMPPASGKFAKSWAKTAKTSSSSQSWKTNRVSTMSMKSSKNRMVSWSPVATWASKSHRKKSSLL